MSKKKEIKKLKREVKELKEIIEELVKRQAGYEYDFEQFENACKRDFKHEREVRNVIIKTVNRHAESIADIKDLVEPDYVEVERENKEKEESNRLLPIWNYGE